MPKDYDSTDLFWTSRGDFFVGGSGDVEDTEYDPLRSLIQEVKTRASSDLEDWENFPDLGATLSDFVGEPNVKNTAESIKVRLISSLTKDGFINNQDIDIKYAPVGVDHLLFRITIAVAPTTRNRNSSQLIYNMLYNYSDNNIYSIS